MIKTNEINITNSSNIEELEDESMSYSGDSIFNIS